MLHKAQLSTNSCIIFVFPASMHNVQHVKGKVWCGVRYLDKSGSHVIVNLMTILI